MTGQTINNATEKRTVMDELRPVLYHQSKWDIPRNVRRHSPECLAKFPGMFGNIPQDVQRYPPACLRTFRGMFGDIPQNVWRHYSECLTIFPGIFEYIQRNVWRHSTEYNIPHHSPRPSHPFPVPVFLVLYIAINRLNFIVWLPLIREILSNVCIIILC